MNPCGESDQFVIFTGRVKLFFGNRALKQLTTSFNSVWHLYKAEHSRRRHFHGFQKTRERLSSTVKQLRCK